VLDAHGNSMNMLGAMSKSVPHSVLVNPTL